MGLITMNFSEMPVEVWADLLEEEGQDTTELREWIASGLKVSESDFYTINSYHYGNYSGDGDGHGNGYGNHSGFGDGYAGNDYDYGHGNGYNDTTE